MEATRTYTNAHEHPAPQGAKNLQDPDDEQTQAIDANERPTQSILDATVVSGTERDFTNSLESMITGYKIVEALPRGGQAVVYKALHTATNTNVAIKVLLPTLLGSERARYYFEREAELIASLDHPNIVSIRDSGIIHGQYYFVMQYIEGQTLQRYVKASRLSFRERVMLFSKICSAITYAHQQGVIHRDLKFANIIVDKRGEPHILDFGLAKAIGMSEEAKEKAVVTMTGQWAGSLSTMSPEQAAGQPNMIDVRTDVYSLGVILYHLLTNQSPYDVTGPTLEVLRNIQEIDPVRPRQIIRKFNSEMEAILLTALAKQREKRYQSAPDLQSDIQNWLEGRPIRVKSISSLYVLRKIMARHRYTTTVVALLVAIVLGFGAISFELLKKSQKQGREKEAITANLRREAKESAQRYSVITPLLFTRFLQAWRDDRTVDAQWMGRYFGHESKDSSEWKAAFFLLSGPPTPEKEQTFKNAFAPEHAWFPQFIIGEHYFKAGNKTKAFDAYHRGYQALENHPAQKRPDFDKLVIEQLKAKLYELRTEEKSTNSSSAIESEGPDK